MAGRFLEYEEEQECKQFVPAAGYWFWLFWQR